MSTQWPTLVRRGAQLPRLVWQFARWGRPKRLLVFGPLSLGDDLLCTTVLREARSRGIPFVMMTARPELFIGNSDPARLLPIDNYYLQALRRLGTQVVHPYYTRADPAFPQRDRLPRQHILAEMCALAGLRGRITLRPYLHLTPDERQAGRRVKRQIAIHSSGLAAAIPYPAKEWGAARFAAVVKELSGEFDFVQLGSARDPLLPVAVDLRGRTSLREAAAILAESMALVGLEGFLAHLARAVDCPSIVVFGGRARPEIFGYTCNENIYNPVACAPCGLREGCPYEMKCMAEITPQQVAAAIRHAILAPRPLVAESAVIAGPLPAA